MSFTFEHLSCFSCLVITGPDTMVYSKSNVQIWGGKVILSAPGGGGTMPRDFGELGPSVRGKGCKREACRPR